MQPLRSLSLSLALLAGGLGLAPAQASAESSTAAPGLGLLASVEQALTAAAPDEVESLTTPTQQVWAQPDGSFVAELSAEPVRVPDGAGGWIPVDTTLVRDSDGGISAAATLADLQLSAGGAAVPLATLSTATESMSLGWAASLPAPTLDGDTATYADVLPGVDLVAKSTARGFATYVVVTTPEAAANPDLKRLSFDLSAPGQRPVDQADGTVAVQASDGTTTFETQPALMWDSKGIPEAAESDVTELIDQPAVSKEAAVDVSIAHGDVLVTPDPALLSSSTTDFPVVIDPNWTPKTLDTSAWAMVWSNGTSFYNASGEDARVGYDGWSSATKKSRTFYRFPVPAYLAGATIHSAVFTNRMVHSPNWTCKLASYGPAVHVYRSNNFSASTNWPGPGLGGLQDSDGYASGSQDAGCAPVNREFDVKSAVVNARNEGADIVVLGMVSANEGNRDGWRRYHNGKVGTTDYPALTVSYSRPPTIAAAPLVPEATDPTPADGDVQYVADNTPTLQATVNDPDGDPLTVCFRIEDQAGALIRNAGCSTNVATAGAGNVTVQRGIATALADSPIGGYYYLEVTADDGLSSVTTSPRRRLVLDTRQPALTTMALSAPGDADGGWVVYGAPGSLALSGDPLAASYKVVVNGTTDPTCTGARIATTQGAARTTGVTATQPSTNTVKAVACSVTGVASPVVTRTLVAKDWAAVHAWTWDSSSSPAPGTDVVTGGGLTLADAGTPVAGRLPGRWPAAQEPGVDQALQLTGGASGQYAATTGPAVTSASFTMAGWVRLDPAWNGSTAVVLAQSGGSTDSARLSAVGSEWRFVIRDSDSTSGLTLTAPLSFAGAHCGVGQWCYVAGSFDAASMTARVRVIPESVGATVYTASQASAFAPYPASGAFRAGTGRTSSTTLDYYLPGVIDRVTVWAGPIDDARLRAAASQQAG